MLASTLLQTTTFIVIASHCAIAQVIPTTPGPNETYVAGSNCTVAWTIDTSGEWTNMTIDLMSGSNNNMSSVTNVVSGLDGTNASLTPFNWTCPEVDPYSAIYLEGGNTSTNSWTTRFTIASAEGAVVPPAFSQQPNGDPVPWGEGKLASISLASDVVSVSTAQMDSDTVQQQTMVALTPGLPSPTFAGTGEEDESDSDGSKSISPSHDNGSHTHKTSVDGDASASTSGGSVETARIPVVMSAAVVRASAVWNSNETFSTGSLSAASQGKPSAGSLCHCEVLQSNSKTAGSGQILAPDPMSILMVLFACAAALQVLDIL